MQSAFPRRVPRWPAFWPLTGAVAVAALVLIVVCQNVASRQYATSNVRPGSGEFTLAQVANSLALAGAIFLGTFVAGQLLAFLRTREAGDRHAFLLDALGTELALVPLPDAGTRNDTPYRDPVRLTLPARLLDGTLLEGGVDREFLAALLALQAAVGRYNDVVLTNAVVLLNGDDAQLNDIARRYHQEVGRTVTAVRRLLPEG